MTEFVPARCPNVDCGHHKDPQGRFWRIHGSYQPACRTKPVARFRCKGCNRSFSRQTFRYDYRDRRPDLNAPLFLLLASGIGLRQAGRVLRLDIRAVQGKKAKMAAMFAQLHANLCPGLPADRTYLLDEEETYEGASIRPLTMPVLIDSETWFVVATAVGAIRRGAVRGSQRRQRQQEDEARHGVRADESEACVRAVLQALAGRTPAGKVVLRTDMKVSYGPLAKEVLGERVAHQVTSSRRLRDTSNPLFAINTTMAMTRDNCGRLRRRSWLVTKKASKLQEHLLLFTIYRNYVRRRFNRDKEAETPARILGLLPRNLRQHEVLAWRQDWGERSIHPMSQTGDRTVRVAVA